MTATSAASARATISLRTRLHSKEMRMTRAGGADVAVSPTGAGRERVNRTQEALDGANVLEAAKPGTGGVEAARTRRLDTLLCRRARAALQRETCVR
eukprot:CAMPEP_0174729848 /NCGR_PEP_ID=MMETSP1094-20130205/54452_1 /TAXON_ID=156173 /ORGANISM="Chrysochromulina brevifilum, Strain UTEX LB 985" /LENGTH=96 /DNA_ID=CAMNT_0015932013 /DNA_START=388 /DNA_END=675 /DNA_ORIENTATION=-